MTMAAGTLPDIEAARLAEIVAPGIKAGGPVGAVARLPAAERLGVDEGRGLQRKADLGIAGQVGIAGLSARAAPGEDVADRPIGEIGGVVWRAVGKSGQDIAPWPRWLAQVYSNGSPRALATADATLFSNPSPARLE